MTTPNPSRPMKANDLREWLGFLALTARSRPGFDVPATSGKKGQIGLIAGRLDKLLTGNKVECHDQRMMLYHYLFDRPFANGRCLAKYEGHALLEWITTAPPDIVAQECQRCLVAYAQERGQVRMEL